MNIEQQNTNRQEYVDWRAASIVFGMLAIGTLLGGQLVNAADRKCIRALDTQRRYEVLYLAQRIPDDAPGIFDVHVYRLSASELMG